MNTITQAQKQKIADFLATHTLCRGLGTEESACSIAAINIALSGELTDAIPDCMSPIIGNWIIRIQDSMPSNIRNSSEWKLLLPFAAGTGREHENVRKTLVMDWLWEVVLTELQPIANKWGFGGSWKRMCEQKTCDAAASASAAAHAAAAYAAYAASNAASVYAYAEFWRKIDPCKLLSKLITISNKSSD